MRRQERPKVKATNSERVLLKRENKVKIQRAYGGCLGARRRRRTRPAAKCHGEQQAGVDPWMSEWGNPAAANRCHPCLNI